MTEVSPTRLPPGWAEATLPELIGPKGLITDGDWVETKDQDPDGEVRLTQLADIGDGIFRDRSSRFLTSEKAAALRCTYLRTDDVLVARMPDPLGRACLFPRIDQPCVTAVDVCIVRPGEADIRPRWLMHFLNAPQTRVAVASFQSGSTRRRISRKNLSRIRLPVPPSTEQARIAAAVDEQLSKLDSAGEALQRVQHNLARYRASVLHAACNGQLVPLEAELAQEEDREYEPAEMLLARILAARRGLEEGFRSGRRQTEPAAAEALPLPRLPEGWCWATVQRLGSSVTGTTPSTKQAENYGGKLPFLKPTDLDAGYAVKEARQHLTGIGAASARVVPAGSVLVTCIGATIGKVGLARVECATNQQINALVPDEAIRWPSYLYWFFASPLGQRLVRENSSSTTLPILNKSRFEQLPVPLPPLAEQARIVQEIERLMSLTASLEEVLASADLRCRRLRQAILSWAFLGKLVRQADTDEPSSDLLGRIATGAKEKQAADHGRRRRGK